MKSRAVLNNSLQLYNKYSSHVVYLYDTIIHDSNKMINNQAHKMCAWLALKTSISQCKYQSHKQQYQLNDEGS